MKPALVTGASGFLGWHVARVLLERGYRVRALVRPGSHVDALDVEPVVGDLRDAASMDAVMRGVEKLYNVAADYRFWAPDPQEIIEANRIGAIIQERDPEMARQRDEALRTGPQLLKSVRPSLGPGLTRSEIGPAASLSAQPRLKDGRRLDDLAPYGFILLCEPGFSAEAPPRTRDLWRQAGLTVVEGEGADWLESLGAKAVIIRPDRYILGVANDLAELEAITSKIPLQSEGVLCG